MTERHMAPHHPASGRGSMTPKSLLILLVVIGGTIAFGVAFLGYMTPDTDDTVMSGHGTAAMVIGVVFSLIVGIGLMALVFFSSRRGVDEDVAQRQNEPQPH